MWYADDHNLATEDNLSSEEPQQVLEVNMKSPDYSTNLIEPQLGAGRTNECSVQLNDDLASSSTDSALVHMQLGTEFNDTLMQKFEGGVLIEGDNEVYSLMQHMDIRLVLNIIS